MENKRIIISSIIGGTVVGVISAVPFLNFINCFCCIGVVAGGAIALIYYDRTLESREFIATATTITIGISTGIAAAFISLLFEWIIFLQFGNWYAELILKIAENLEEIPPELQKMIETIEEEGQYGFSWTAILFRNVIVMPIFCIVGSFITRLYLNKNRSEDNII